MFLFQDRTVWPLWIIVRVSHDPSEIICLIFFREQWYRFQYSWTEIEEKKKQNLFEKIFIFYIIYIFTVTFDLLNVKNNYTCIIYWLYFRIQNNFQHFCNYNILPLSFIFQKCFMHFLRAFMHFPPQPCYAVIFYYTFLSITLTSISFWR